MKEKRFTLRMNQDLFDQISTLAKKNLRSTAKEIECAIAFYLQNQDYFNELKLKDLENHNSY